MFLRSVLAWAWNRKVQFLSFHKARWTGDCELLWRNASEIYVGLINPAQAPLVLSRCETGCGRIVFLGSKSSSLLRGMSWPEVGMINEGGEGHVEPPRVAEWARQKGVVFSIRIILLIILVSCIIIMTIAIMVRWRSIKSLPKRLDEANFLTRNNI